MGKKMYGLFRDAEVYLVFRTKDEADDYKSRLIPGSKHKWSVRAVIVDI